jgi:predicted nucleotidyltransferase
MAVDHGTQTGSFHFGAVDTIIRQYISEVKAQFPIDKVYLYGSYAKGTAEWDSDVDLCFFSSSFKSGNIFDALKPLWQLKRKYDKEICIEPNAFPSAELQNDNPFVKEILRTGFEITV